MSSAESRTKVIAHALEASTQLHETLLTLDLRTTRGDLRAALRAAREASARQCDHLLAALNAGGPSATAATATSPRPEVPA